MRTIPKSRRTIWFYVCALLLIGLLLSIDSNAVTATTAPVVDGRLDNSYTFVGRVSMSGGGANALAPGNLYQAEVDGVCYYAFVVDRAYNDNVFADDDRSYLQEDGWTGGHGFEDLEESDNASFEITYPGGTKTFTLDYIKGNRASDLTSGLTGDDGSDTSSSAPYVSAAKTSLDWNYENSGWTSLDRSPDYDYNETSGNYWEWNMIYEFSIPKSALADSCGTVDQAGAHNSPNKNDENKSTIGDRVWEDVDRDGVQDSGEDGLPGIVLRLYKDTGNGSFDPNQDTHVRTTQTEAGVSGYYIFNNLEAGTYFVDVDESTLPTDYTITTNNEPLTVILGADEDYLLADFGYYLNKGSIGDRVWYDLNGDGVQDSNEIGINGVTVELYDEACASRDSAVATAVTTGDGNYVFNGLDAGDYCVVVDESTLPEPTFVSTTHNNPADVDLGAGENRLDVDFGYVANQCLPTIDFDTDALGNALAAGTVVDDEYAGWGVYVTSHDFDNHPPMIFDSANPTGGDPDLGTPNQDFGGPGIGSGGGSGMPGENSQALDNVLIISEDNDAGDPDDKGTGGTLVFTFTQSLRLDQVQILDIDDNEAGGAVTAYDATNGGSEIASGEMLGLGDNSFQVVPLDATGVRRLEVDFPSSGAVPALVFCGTPPARYDVGDFIWHDLNADGIQDSGEPGIAGVEMELYVGSTLAEVVQTDASGLYTFTNLPDGTYTVKIADSNFATGGILEAFTPSPPGAGGDSSTDSDFDPTDHEASVVVSGGDDFTIDGGFYVPSGVDSCPALVDWLGDYNLTTLDNLSTNSEVEGRLFVGNDYTNANSATLASQLSTLTADETSVVIAGDILSGNAIHVTYGSLRLGGAVQGGRTIDLQQSGASLINVPALSDAAITALLQDASTTMADATPNNSASLPSGSPGPATFTVNMVDSSGLAIFEVAADDLFGNTNVQQIELNPGGASTILINVSGTNVDWQGGNMVSQFTDNTWRSRVIWNFHEATSIDLGGKNFNGTLLAPFADLTIGGPIDGSVAVKSLTASSEVHLPVFAGDLTNACVSVDYAIEKTLNTPDPVRIGEVISFSIHITNTGSVTLTTVPLTDTYDADYLVFVGSTPGQDSPQDGDNTGTIAWNDLTVSLGDLGPNDFFEIMVQFVASEDTTTLGEQGTINYAGVHDAEWDPDGDGGTPPQGPLPPKQDSAGVRIFNPTAVGLAEQALTVAEDATVIVNWRTEDESNVAGFRIYRTHNGETQLLAEMAAEHSGQPTGQLYTYRDTNIKTNQHYEYSLKVIGLDQSVVEMDLGSIFVGSERIYLPSVSR